MQALIINFLKKNTLTLILIGLLVFFIYEYKQGRKEIARISANQTILEKGRLSDQKNYNRHEFKEYYPELKAILEQYGLSYKQVDHYIQNSYNFKDSAIISHYTRIDSFPDTRFFTIYDNCYEISGISYKDSVITQAYRHDTLKTFLYREGNKDIYWLWRPLHKLFRNDGWIYKGITISSCNNDTIQVDDNVKINR